MISRIAGKIAERGNNYLIIDVNGLAYQVFVPATVMQRIDDSLAPDGKVSLQTFHYLQSDSAKSIPVFPLAVLLITLTLSIGTQVGPAVINILLPARLSINSLKSKG